MLSALGRLEEEEKKTFSLSTQHQRKRGYLGVLSAFDRLEEEEEEEEEKENLFLFLIL